MAIDSKIQWCDATFNGWRGCVKVSPGCAHCYAETMSHRNPVVLGEWGPGSYRAIASESYWREPVKWNARCEKEGRRMRVFCASLGDVFEEHPDLTLPRMRLFDLIRGTPSLDWLLLTKRPENIERHLATAIDHAYGVPQVASEHAEWLEGWLTHLAIPPNVWLGVSVEDQQRADERIPILLNTPAAVRFLSVEPLLGPVHLLDDRDGKGIMWREGIDWCIIGGESGHGARPCDLAWIRSLVGQCKAAGVACFVKQLGRVCIDSQNCDSTGDRYLMADQKGGDMKEFPEDLCIREFPQPVSLI